MTYQEGLSYLKPFIFEVHPDFFEQHPKQKEVNQNSLKLLYNYLNSLDNTTKKYISLQFFVRKKRDKAELSLLKLNLNEISVNNAINEILTSAKTFIRVNNFPPKIHIRDIRTVIYNENAFKETGDIGKKEKNVIEIINWLEETILKETEARNRSMIVSNKIKEINLKILSEHNITDILWLSNYNIDKHYTSLISLSRVLDHLNFDLEIRKIIYTSDEKSGINCYGDIVLSCKQVEDVWKKEFKNFHKNLNLLIEIKQIESEISKMLQNSKIKLLEDMHMSCLAKDYKENLLKLQFSLSLLRADKYNRINSCYEYAISDMTSIPFIHSSGVIVIPALIESKSLLNYLDNNLNQAINSTKADHIDHINLFNRLKEVFSYDFNCRDVILNVHLIDGIGALKKLLNLLRLNNKILNFDYSDLIIDHYYGTTSSGDVIIPFNFE